MNKNKALIFFVPVFLLLFTTFQNFDESKKSSSDIDFNTLVDDSYEEMSDAKKTAEGRKVYYRQLRKAEILQNKLQPKYFIDNGQQSAALEERIKEISKKSNAKKKRGSASLPNNPKSVERELIQADK